MSLFKFVARAAAAAPMVRGGLNAAQNADQLTGIIEEFIDSLPQQVKSQLSDVEPALLAKINGCTMVAASAAMVLGIKPRTAATILALQLVPAIPSGTTRVTPVRSRSTSSCATSATPAACSPSRPLRRSPRRSETADVARRRECESRTSLERLRNHGSGPG